MENNQINNNVNFETKYSPLKDGSFWTAFIVSLLLGGQSFLILLTTGRIIPTFYVGLVVLISWTGWIIYKKGKKGSLIVGFIIALILAVITFFLTMQL